MVRINKSAQNGKVKMRSRKTASASENHRAYEARLTRSRARDLNGTDEVVWQVSSRQNPLTSTRYLKRCKNLKQAYQREGSSLDSKRLAQYIKEVIRRLEGDRGSNESNPTKDSLENLVNLLAKHEAIFLRLLDYASSPVARMFSVKTMSQIKAGDLTTMGVRVLSAVSIDQLVENLTRSPLPDQFNYQRSSDFDWNDYDIFSKNRDPRQMRSPSESNARYRISSILGQIFLKQLQDVGIHTVGEEVSIGHRNGRAGPIEVQFTDGSGTVHSNFISGRLDYACFSPPPSLIQMAMEKDVEATIAAMAVWQKEDCETAYREPFGTLVDQLERGLKKFSLSTGSNIDNNELQWDIFTLEAKRMGKRVTFIEAEDSPSEPKNRTEILQATPLVPVMPVLEFSTNEWNLYALNPSKLIQAYKDLETLLPRQFVSSTVLDLYVLVLSQNTHAKGHGRYIPIDFMTSAYPTEHEIAQYRDMYSLSNTDPCPSESVVGILFESAHFYVVAVLPQSKEVHILGKNIDTHHRRVDKWSGLKGRLSRMSDYEGLDMRDFRIFHSDWPQNGTDCGPIACQVVESIIRDGFRRHPDHHWLMPPSPCPHHTRKVILCVLSELIPRFLEQFSRFCNGNEDLLRKAYETNVDELRRNVEAFLLVIHQDSSVSRNSLLSKIDAAMKSCALCQADPRELVNDEFAFASVFEASSSLHAPHHDHQAEEIASVMSGPTEASYATAPSTTDDIEEEEEVMFELLFEPNHSLSNISISAERSSQSPVPILDGICEKSDEPTTNGAANPARQGSNSVKGEDKAALKKLSTYRSDDDRGGPMREGVGESRLGERNTEGEGRVEGEMIDIHHRTGHDEDGVLSDEGNHGGYGEEEVRYEDTRDEIAERPNDSSKVGRDDLVEEGERAANQEIPMCDNNSKAHKGASSDATTENTRSRKTTSKSKSLHGHLPQAIGQCLAAYYGLEPDSRRPKVIKFCISTSNEWLFGLLNFGGDGYRECYATETLTISTEEDVRSVVFLLTTWLLVPGLEIMPYFQQLQQP